MDVSVTIIKSLHECILVFGSGSYIGSRFLKFWKSIEMNPSMKYENRFQNAEIYNLKCNLEDKNLITSLVNQLEPTYIIHFANSRKIYNEIKIQSSKDLEWDTNYTINRNLLYASKNVKGLKLFLFLGSIAEYGKLDCIFSEDLKCEPNSSYGLMKYVMSQAILDDFDKVGFPGVILRPSVVYGPGNENGMLIDSLVRNLNTEKTIKLTKGEQFRDFLYVDDLIQGIYCAILQYPKAVGQIFNIAFGSSITIKELSNIVLGNFGIEKKHLIQFGSNEYNINEVFNYFVDISKIRVSLNWNPRISPVEGIKKLLYEG